MDDMLRPYTPGQPESVTEAEMAALVAQTAPGETYTAESLYLRYRRICEGAGMRPASSSALGRRLRTEGWTPGRKRHGTVRVWTRPEATA